MPRTEQFAPYGIRPRRKYERLDPNVDWHEIYFEELLPPGVAKFEVIGQFDGFTPLGVPQLYDTVVLTTEDGRTLPYCRVHAPGMSYALCDLRHVYKSGRTSNVV